MQIFKFTKRFDCFFMSLYITFKQYFKTGTWIWVEDHDYVQISDDDQPLCLVCTYCGKVSN